MLKSKTIHPIKATILILVVLGLLMLIPLKKLLSHLQFSDFQSDYTNLFFKMSLVFSLSYFIIKRLKIENISGMSPNYKWKFKALNLIPFYLFLIGIASVASKDFSEVIPFNLLILFTGCLSVGFAEEFLFRGLLQPLFLSAYVSKNRGVLIGVFCAALSFGLFHLINLFSSESVLPVFTQVIYATFIGFFFGVMVLKTNKIMPLAITHGLINFFFSLQFLPGLKPALIEETPNDIGSAIAPLLLTLPLFIIGLILLPKINIEEVKEKLPSNFN